ncbi:MAG: multifunctional CCA addition/repair protein [Gammaproteobacteria bacterium]|jgi:tRNA nucleotidyltransferase (CCA-adding enzyme)|nr:multifunctional CCA addition/repair protein [Gammaproteobacteria bacterium]MBT3490473.1 multifunctional CCA addition/repair protein [Gammaproteobacteria bacterium]MBT3717596.1 multifunctional CCA addition/repair protein [Gammaproteobacteria bacterium]MBT3845789.1 multifunctional CCA addition/repair protein [Gammaproteobacteria bacterium]MBT3893603.1 multifunctional CCA addition/repair protein [Gammaproteobacteria bacterium]
MNTELLHEIEESRFLVGGAVRDRLLGIPVNEQDWVVIGVTEQQMLSAGFQPVGKDFPVFLHPKTKEEHALARTERKTAPGYQGFTVHTAPDVTLEEDLLRRDLTINAMAQTSDEQLVDPFNGKEDLQQGLLRHVSEAFIEDPVRILRVARFAARFGQWGFKVAHKTHRLMKQMVENGEVDALVPERVWQETLKALETPRPDRFFEVLRQCGALERIYPELDALFGIPQPAHHHPEIDCGVHTLMVLQQAVKLSDQATLRFAALLHDLGKGTTPQQAWPKHHGHESRSKRLVKQICERLKVPKAFRELALAVAEYHGHYHRADEMRPATILKVFEGVDAFRRPQRFEEFLLVCEADQRGRTGFEEAIFSQGETLRSAFEAAQSVKTESILEDGFQGIEIREEFKKRRISAISQSLSKRK